MLYWQKQSSKVLFGPKESTRLRVAFILNTKSKYFGGVIGYIPRRACRYQHFVQLICHTQEVPRALFLLNESIRECYQNVTEKKKITHDSMVSCHAWQVKADREGHPLSVAKLTFGLIDQGSQATLP